MSCVSFPPHRESPFIPLSQDIIDECNAQSPAPPAHWDQVYAGILKMRQPGGAAYDADVDTLGCALLFDPHADKNV